MVVVPTEEEEEEKVEQTSTRQLWSVTDAINLDIFGMKPSWNKEANYAKLDEEEEMLLMSYVELYKGRREDVWFLDSGCSNHMSGDRTMFNELDEKF